ncbi:MAG: NTP transferase domain-containing protein, partial [Candidatus Omnitrophica bacterium]|nr:NTP transferase domain-containing protein [Candidatus Omnitrophota bacterium]
MKAVIVAAGLSSRMYPFTEKMPKPLLKIGGKSIIESSIDKLRAHGVNDIAVVVGYLKERFFGTLSGRVVFFENPRFAETNNMVSLACAREYVRGEDFLYLHGDLVYDEGILSKCMAGKGDIVLAVDRKECDEEDMKV